MKNVLAWAKQKRESQDDIRNWLLDFPGIARDFALTTARYPEMARIQGFCLVHMLEMARSPPSTVARNLDQNA